MSIWCVVYFLSIRCFQVFRCRFVRPSFASRLYINVKTMTRKFCCVALLFCCVSNVRLFVCFLFCYNFPFTHSRILFFSSHSQIIRSKTVSFILNLRFVCGCLCILLAFYLPQTSPVLYVWLYAYVCNVNCKAQVENHKRVFFSSSSFCFPFSSTRTVWFSYSLWVVWTVVGAQKDEKILIVSRFCFKTTKHKENEPFGKKKTIASQ